MMDLIFFGLIILGIFLLPIIPMVFQLLWNDTMPELFGWKTIRFWQSVRLLLMAWILLSVPYCGNHNASSHDHNQQALQVSSVSVGK